jgi:sugar/nucleoside kinase (ribokinase family)
MILQKAKRRKSSRVAVGAGFVALDVIFNEARTGGYIALGGSTGNVLAILGYLGWAGMPVARLGHDRAAHLIREEFIKLNADTTFLTANSPQPTPVVYQFSEHGTHRFTTACPYCGDKRRRFENAYHEVSDEVLGKRARSDVFYFDRVSEPTVYLAEQYRNRGSLVMFEPSAIPSDEQLFARAVRVSHIIKYANDRIDRLVGLDLRSVAVEIQTLGEKGLRFRSPSLANDWLSMPSFPIPHIADTAGAGDWSTAAMIHYLFEYESFAHVENLTPSTVYRSLRFGQALAALNCLHGGARGLSHRWSANYVVKSAHSLVRASSSQSKKPAYEYWRRDPGPTLYEHIVRGSTATHSRRSWARLEDLCCKALAV